MSRWQVFVFIFLVRGREIKARKEKVGGVHWNVREKKREKNEIGKGEMKQYQENHVSLFIQLGPGQSL